MKKKFFALGIALLAGVTLAACDSNNQTTTTATATDTATATATVDDGLTYHEGYEATYTTKGMKPYYTRGKKPGYLDENKQTCTLDDLLIDYLTLEGKVTSVDTLGFAHTNIPVEDFFKAFNYEYMLTITVDGKDPVDVPYVKWANELADGDVALGVDEDVVFVGDAAKASELGLKENATFTLKYNDSKLYKSKYEAMNHLYEKGPVDVSGKELTLTYEKGAQDTYLATAQAVLDALEAEEVEGEEILALYDEFVDTYYMLVDEYRKAKIISDKDNGKEDYEIADELEALVDDFGAQDELIDIAAYKSAKYKEIYYSQYDEYKNEDGTLNEEAVKAYVDGLDPEATATLNEISQRMSGALSSYYAKESTAAEALTAYLTAAKEYATAAGYDDYLHYAYESDFGREYTVEDSNNLAQYVKDYIIPASNYCEEVFNEFDEASAADAKTTRVYANAWNEMIALYNNFYGNYFKYFADYAENKIGDEMAENFHYYFESGNYWYSATENDNVTGYVWSFSDGTPLMFLGYENQASSTFIHEFGHYNEAITSKGSDFYSMDLNEVHSQGNEMLFYLYLTETDAASEIATKEFLNYKTYQMFDAVISGYLINEVEKWAYTQDLTTYETPKKFEEALFAKWKEICKEAGADTYANATSWVELVLLNYQGYYISYAVSAVAALELYAVAVDDYDAAVAAYKKLYAPHEATDTFTSVLEEAGLYSVFNEEAYKKIANAVIVEEE